MKKTLLLGASLVAMGIAPAFAADLPARAAPAYTKAPVMAPMYNWSGFYGGLNVGGASSHNCWNITNDGFGPVPSTGIGCHDATGGLAGGQIGYRWQMTNWVFGLEAQGGWASLKGSNTSTIGTFGGFPFTDQTKIDGIGLFTGQVGYAWNNVLWYGKGGAAVTHDTYSGISQVTVGAFPAGFVFDQAKETRWGGAIGTGLEFGLGAGWSIAVEYDHLFMGSGGSVNFINFQGGFDRANSIKQDVDMGTVRVNYTFGGPIVAKY